MALTAADIQSIIIDEIGDVDPATGDPPSPASNGRLYVRIATYWASYADKALVGPRLQELYTRRRCIDVVIGLLRDQVNMATGTGLSVSQQQRVQALEHMRAAVETELERVESIGIGQRVASVGSLTTTTPIPAPTTAPPYGPPDANDGAYRGSPYYPGRGVRE